MLPSFCLTGNSCPASSRRLCQPPPLEYFRDKSENDQLPPNLFFHRPYMGILGCSGLFPSSLCSLQKDANTQAQEALQRVFSHLQHPYPYLSAATLAHGSAPYPPGSQWHSLMVMHLLRSRSSQHPLPLRTFTPDTVTLLSHHRVAFSHVHLGQE